MVRPIEISDALAKAQEVGRMQQNAQTRPEAAQEYEKTVTGKLHLQKAQSPDPVPETDQVVLHIDEKERERRRAAADEEEKRRNRKKPGYSGNAGRRKNHIDLKA